VVLPQLKLTKLELEYLKSGFNAKKKDINTNENFFASLEFDYFRVQLKFAFRIRLLVYTLKNIVLLFVFFLFIKYCLKFAFMIQCYNFK